MKIPTSKLGYTAAVMTVFAAVLVPFLLLGFFSKGFAHLGFHVDEVYSGGSTIRTLQANGYSIDINHPVYPHLWQSEKPFVQIAWSPVNALPARVSDTLDLDGDGQPDVRVSFDVPKEPKALLHVDVEPLSTHYEALHDVAKPAFSRLIARVPDFRPRGRRRSDDAIVVRVPLAGR